MILFIDTETTGLPNKYSEIHEQPYLVQIAAILCDDSRQPVAQVNRVIRPDGWTIPLEATAIHGFTTDSCRRLGVPLGMALSEVLALWSQAERIIAYNISFDYMMLQFSAQRAGLPLPQRELYCAMKEASKLISDSGRWMKLGAAYRCFFGRDFENKHNAMADVQACMAIYFALQDALAPITRLIGDVQGISGAKLQKALSGAKEVEEHQGVLDSLIQLHCSPLKSIDWARIAAQQKPQPPDYSRAEENAAAERLKSYRPNIFMKLLELDRERIAALEGEVEQARIRDRERHEEALAAFRAKAAAVEQHRRTAKRVLAGDQDAFNEVMDHCEIAASPLLARKAIYSFVGPDAVEVFAYLNGPEAIPEQTKTLLASGRVSVRKAQKKEFAALYQDHICSAALRIARDLMALLPIKNVLLHGYTSATDPATGGECERCVLSCILNRRGFQTIEFDRVDPSDCVESFPHAMKISKGRFQEVSPLSFIEETTKGANR
ncbi:MAG: 3'-5' exonuclease [Tepidisphaeraceae bacterium]